MNTIYLLLFSISIFCLIFFILKNIKYKKETSFDNTSFNINKSNVKRTGILLFAVIFILISILLNVIYAIIITIIISYVLWNKSVKEQQKYKKNIDKQIFELIRLFRNSIAAGESFIQSIESVSSQIKEPLSSEFKEILNKVNMGISLDEALKISAQNINNDQYKIFTDSLRLSYSTGIKMSDILLKIEESLNQKMALSSKVEVLTSQVRFSGNIVSFIPFIILVLVWLFEPEMISVLFTTVIGNAVLLISVLMILMGAFAMKKIADIKL